MNFRKITMTLAGILMMVLSFNVESVAQSTDKNVTIIELHQVNGAFTTENLDLKPGLYQFRIVNTEVEKEVGFVIQAASDKDGDVMKTAVENSFASKMINKGEHAYSGVVNLTAGEYVYSCPLNPTPKYTLSIK